MFQIILYANGVKKKIYLLEEKIQTRLKIGMKYKFDSYIQPHNPWVVGSSPTGGAIQGGRLVAKTLVSKTNYEGSNPFLPAI